MQKGARLLWTNEETEVLLGMAKQGKTNAEIAKVLKLRTPEAIEKKRNAFGIPETSSVPRVDMDAYAKMMKGEATCL